MSSSVTVILLFEGISDGLWLGEVDGRLVGSSVVGNSDGI